MNLPPRSGLSLIIKPAGEEQAVQFQSAEWIYKKLLPVESITFDPASVKPKAAAAAVVNKTEIFVPLEGLIDFDKERKRLQKEIDRLQGFLTGIEDRKSTRLNSSHVAISYAVFCLK